MVSSARVDRVVANSRLVAWRIKHYWNREAEVIPPPVATEYFTPGGERSKNLLTVAALVPYKRVEVAIAIARELGRPLEIVGGRIVRTDVARVALHAGDEVIVEPDDTAVAFTEQRCQLAREGALADGDRSRNPDDVGHLRGPGAEERRDNYACDITYGTAKEFGFDFLRDRLLIKAPLIHVKAVRWMWRNRMTWKATEREPLPPPTTTEPSPR